MAGIEILWGFIFLFLSLIMSKYILPFLPEPETVGKRFISFKRLMIKLLKYSLYIFSSIVLSLLMVATIISRFFGYDIVYEYGFNPIDRSIYNFGNPMMNLSFILNAIVIFIYNSGRYRMYREGLIN